MVRRSRYVNGDLLMLSSTNRDHWMVTLTAYRRLIEFRKLPAGSDLVGAYLEQLLYYHRAGWRIVGFGSTNSEFFVSKEGEEKRHVAITSSDPSGK